MAEDLVVAFWNRRHGAAPAPQAEWLGTAEPACGCPPWDVLILAEVRRAHAEVYQRILQPASVAWWGKDIAGVSEDRTAHGIMVLSRVLPLGDADRPRVPTPDVPTLPSQLVSYAQRHLEDAGIARTLKAERWLSTALPVEAPSAPGRAVRVAGFHAPYAAGSRLWDTLQNRLTKRRAYQELTSWVQERNESGEPLVLGMDGNNWVDWLDEPPKPREAPRARSPWRQMLSKADLFDAELAFHGADPPHGLVDTLRVAALEGNYEDNHGSRAAAEAAGKPLAVTYRLKRDAHRMDRIYASPGIRVLAAGVCHGPLDTAAVAATVKGDDLAPGSDHALVWARLALRPTKDE